jgi:NAD(P)-dependent dehydrogenase (short-subunit alcohol dehydrogenase family)
LTVALARGAPAASGRGDAALGERLRDKVALVFGAGSVGPGWGNGKATAVAFADEGARVVAVDIDPGAVEETAAVIRERGHPCLALTADVTNSGEVEAAVAKALEAHGRIDVLHNNVGLSEAGGPVELAEETWQRVMDVNLKSLFLTCKRVLPVMERQGKGAIINTSSLAGIRWTGYRYIAYNTAKAGVNQFTRALAVQYADRGIRVNAVLPGLMDTPLIYTRIQGRHADVDAMRRERAAAVPMKRMGDAWDVARAAVFLASDDAGYITGVVLPVDGGISLKCV